MRVSSRTIATAVLLQASSDSTKPGSLGGSKLLVAPAVVRDYPGHTDARSTDKYAKVTSKAPVDVAKCEKHDTQR